MSDNAIQIAVHLQDHIVERKHPTFGVVKETLPQKYIYVSINGSPAIAAGYVGTQPNAPINLVDHDIVSLPKDYIDAITAKVRELLPSASPTNIGVAPIIGEETVDDLDESDVEDLPSEDELMDESADDSEATS